jgi:hypothetical protein
MLPITVPLRAGETPASFVSRLARANGRDRARHFCRDIGLDFQAVVDGDPVSLEHLAALAGSDPADLHAWAIAKTPDGFRLRNQEIARGHVRRNRLVVCPACIAADLADDRLDPVLRPAGRTAWQIAPIRTCLTHDETLVELERFDEPDVLHDLVAAIEPHLADVAAYPDRCQRTPTAFERYLHERLMHGSGGSPWLDGLTFAAAARACEVIGAVAEHGPGVEMTALDAEAMRTAGAAGYAIAADGETGIRRFVKDLQRPFHEERHAWGPKALFGRLYEWLAHESDDYGLHPLRALLERHVVETMPVGPGDTLFGREVTARKLHSIHSASQAYGLHPKTLRRRLRDAGYLDDTAMAASDERALFDAEAAAGFLQRLSTAMSLNAAGRYLNAPRPVPRLLFENGYIVPFVGDENTGSDYAFDRADLDAFLARLMGNARHDTEGLVEIRRAAKRANCSQLEIVDLLLAGRLRRVGVDPESSRYLAIRVDVDEVRERVRGADHGGIRLRDVEKRMGWSTQVVRALVDERLLPSRTAINPKNRCPQTVVDEDDLRDFDAQYVSLKQLAVETGVHFKRLKRELQEAGVSPDPRFEDVPSTFYQRDEVALVIEDFVGVSPENSWGTAGVAQAAE